MAKFETGHKNSPEQEYRRIQSMRESWKKRKDYIADLLKDCPELHTKWRAIHHTEKGKEIGCSEEWKDYRTFYNDVRPSYKKGLMLVRPDTSKPFGKDNFIFIDKSEMSTFKSGRIRLTYDGETLLLSDWAERLGLSLAGIRIRYHRHAKDYSVEEILFGRKRKRFSKERKGFTDTKSSIRAKASKMISSYKHKDLVMGVSVCDMDINWAMENIFSKPCVYCGDTYRVGADRLDNTKGHTKDNVVPCCVECNTAKNEHFTYEEMLIIGKAIAEVKAKRPKVDRGEIDMDEALNPKNPSDFRWNQKTLQFDKDHNLVASYDSVKEAAEKTGLTPKGISAACGFRGGRLYHGFFWEHEKK